MKARKGRRKKPYISVRAEIHADPLLHAPVEVKSRLVDERSSMLLRAKLAFLKQQYPLASTAEIHDRLSDFLNRLTRREQMVHRSHG